MIPKSFQALLCHFQLLWGGRRNDAINLFDDHISKSDSKRPSYICALKLEGSQYKIFEGAPSGPKRGFCFCLDLLPELNYLTLVVAGNLILLFLVGRHWR
jgi:hypothetical protein